MTISMDPRTLFDRQIIALEDIKVGDFIGARYWSRPRLVLALEGDAEGKSLILAEMDTTRMLPNGTRMLTQPQFEKRAPFYILPNLTALWAEAGVSPTLTVATPKPKLAVVSSGPDDDEEGETDEGSDDGEDDEV